MKKICSKIVQIHHKYYRVGSSLFIIHFILQAIQLTMGYRLDELLDFVEELDVLKEGEGVFEL